MKTRPVIQCELITAQIVTFMGWSCASSISRGVLSHYRHMFCLFTYLFIQKWHLSLNHMLKSILGLAVRTIENSSANARRLCWLNAVNFCKTCTLYGNKPIYSLSHRTISGLPRHTELLSELVDGGARFSFNSIRTTSLFSFVCAVRFAPTFVTRLSYTLPHVCRVLESCHSTKFYLSGSLTVSLQQAAFSILFLVKLT